MMTTQDDDRIPPLSRFFFDTDDGEHFVHDEEGLDCADAAAVRGMALKALLDMASDVMLDGGCRDISTDVRDATGRRVFTATLSLVTQWATKDQLPPDISGLADFYRPGHCHPGALSPPEDVHFISSAEA
ncbi:DUF6894 family protein [Muricoccus radiodurans]|uniref:DUF6894 family protein n=1 Tax=Muricoccus radiodurans TaxID=2231721 RepID=UPI003CE80A5D